MGFTRIPPTDVYRSDQIDSQEYKDLGTSGLAKKVVLYGSDGVDKSGLSIPAFDYVSLSIASATETYTFKTGGSGGTTVATVTIVYTDSSRADILTVTKT